MPLGKKSVQCPFKKFQAVDLKRDLTNEVGTVRVVRLKK